MTPKQLYTQKDIAAILGVARATVTQWYSRPVPIAPPEPEYVTSAGHQYWSDMTEWIEWNAARIEAARASDDLKLTALKQQRDRLDSLIAKYEKGRR